MDFEDFRCFFFSLLLHILFFPEFKPVQRDHVRYRLDETHPSAPSGGPHLNFHFSDCFDVRSIFTSKFIDVRKFPKKNMIFRKSGDPPSPRSKTNPSGQSRPLRAKPTPPCQADPSVPSQPLRAKPTPPCQGLTVVA